MMVRIPNGYLPLPNIVCFTHPRVLAAIAHVLRQDFKLSSLNVAPCTPTLPGANIPNRPISTSISRRRC